MMLNFDDVSAREFIFIMDFFGTVSNLEDFLNKNNLSFDSLLDVMRFTESQLNYEHYLKVTKQK